MQEMAPVTDLQALARSLDALIAFADQEGNFVLAATLDAARVQFSELYGQSKD
jgi:hypothetical protein